MELGQAEALGVLDHHDGRRRHINADLDHGGGDQELALAGREPRHGGVFLATLHLAVNETGGKVEYLHRIEPGRAEKSFGIYVAQLAGLPKPVIHRAQALLDQYDGDARPAKSSGKLPASNRELAALVESLAKLDINQLSPVEALTKLYELQQRLSAVRKLPEKPAEKLAEKPAEKPA